MTPLIMNSGISLNQTRSQNPIQGLSSRPGPSLGRRLRKWAFEVIWVRVRMWLARMKWCMWYSQRYSLSLRGERWMPGRASVSRRVGTARSPPRRVELDLSLPLQDHRM